MEILLKCRLDEMQCVETCHDVLEKKKKCGYCNAIHERTGKTIHYLKTWLTYYREISDGNKTFEMRKNDRDYKVGDILCLQDYDPVKEEYSGDELWREISHILAGGNFGIEKGHVGISMKPFEP